MWLLLPSALMAPQSNELDTIDGRLRDIAAQVKYGFQSMDKRLDRLEEAADRVPELEGKIETMQRTSQERHESNNRSMRDLIEKVGRVTGISVAPSDEGIVRWSTLKTVVVASISTGGIVIAAMKLFGK